MHRTVLSAKPGAAYGDICTYDELHKRTRYPKRDKTMSVEFFNPYCAQVLGESGRTRLSIVRMKTCIYPIVDFESHSCATHASTVLHS